MPRFSGVPLEEEPRRPSNRFGGIPLETEARRSRFGGEPLEEEPPARGGATKPAPLLDQLSAGFDEYRANRATARALGTIQDSQTVEWLRGGGLAKTSMDMLRGQIRLETARGNTKEAERLQTRLTEAEASLQDPERLARFDAAKQDLTETLQEAINRRKELSARAATVQLSDASRRTAEAETIGETFGAFAEDPLRVVAELGLRSAPNMLEIVPATLGGALVGGPVGAAAGTFAGSAMVEYRASVAQSLQEAGVDLDDAQSLLDAAADTDLMESIYRKAAVRAGFIGSVDAATMGVAGRVLTPFKQPLAREATNLLAQTGVQMAGGATGEAGAQLLTEGRVRPGSVFVEGIAEGVSTPVDVATATAAGLRGTVAARAARDHPFVADPPSAETHTDEEASDFAQLRLRELQALEGNLSPAEQQEIDFLRRDGRNPEALARAYGVKLSPLTEADLASPIPNDLIREGKELVADALRAQEAPRETDQAIDADQGAKPPAGLTSDATARAEEGQPRGAVAPAAEADGILTQPALPAAERLAASLSQERVGSATGEAGPRFAGELLETASPIAPGEEIDRGGATTAPPISEQTDAVRSVRDERPGSIEAGPQAGAGVEDPGAPAGELADRATGTAVAVGAQLDGGDRVPAPDLAADTERPLTGFERLRARKRAAAALRGERIDKEWVNFAPSTGTLNVPRDDMPQIKAEHRGALANFLKARGIEGAEETVAASTLKPTQREFSEKKVAKAKSFEGGDRAILVSADGYVLDGHHQLVARADRGEEIRIIRLNAPIRELLKVVPEFPSAEGGTPDVAAAPAPRVKPGVARPPEASIAPSALRAPPDARLSSDKYRRGIEALSNELVRGGGIATIMDDSGKVRSRTPSENPQWFQTLAAQSETKVSVDQLRKAVERALTGKLMGAREKRVVIAMLDQLDAEQAEDQRRLDAEEAAIFDYTPTAEEIKAANVQDDPEAPAHAALLAKAREIDENAVQDAARQHENDDAGFLAAVQAIVDRQGAKADEAVRPDTRAPETDLGGEVDRGAQALADEQRRRDEARSPNRGVSLETGDPSDLFSKARNQVDLVDQARAKPPSERSEPPEKPAAARPSAPREPAKSSAISDFGQKIEGARKDYAAKLNDAQSVDVAAAPLSESWPEPDYQQLLDGGADPRVVAFVHAARDEIPTKPQRSWKLKEWTKQVTQLRDFATRILGGVIEADKVMTTLDDFNALKSVKDRVKLYLEVGHEKSLKGVTISAASYSTYNGQHFDQPKIIWSVERKAPKTAMSNWPRQLGTGATREEAIADFKKKWAATSPEQDEKKAVTFNIYGIKGGYGIGRKVGRKVLILKRGFDKVKVARAYLAEHQAELVTMLERAKQTPNERRPDNSPRVGIDHRNGADVTPERFTETFAFRGVQFGNYVEGGRRQADLNESYDALMDLAGVLDVPPKALSLHGELGLAFGARGKGGIGAASAHYEPDRVVINLTKKQGAGALAHEWFHALDNYFSRKGKKPMGFVTARAEAGEGVRPEMAQAFAAVRVAIQRSPMANRSRTLDRTRAKDYWSTGEELAARAFESYVIAKQQDQSASNDYLANIVSKEYWDAETALGLEERGEETYPYPAPEEMGPIREAFDAFFETVETRETEAGVEMFSLGDDLGFFSSLRRAVEGLKQERGTAEQMLAAIRKTPGVKEDEIEWTGLADYLKAPRSVTKAEIVAFLDANGVKVEELTIGEEANAAKKLAGDLKVRLDALGYDTETDYEGQLISVTNRQQSAPNEYFYDDNGLFSNEEGEPLPQDINELAIQYGRAIENANEEGNSRGTVYEQYTLPGGENYREVLLTLPQKATQDLDGFARAAFGKPYDELTSSERSAVQTQLFQPEAVFRSSHFPFPNILAHVRLKDRTTADGKRVLFVEEIQSDWAQHGRRKGFAGKEPQKFKVVDNAGRMQRGNLSRDEADQLAASQGFRVEQDVGRPEMQGAPRGPFVEKTDAWAGLAIKRVIRMAVDGGYDAVAWTTGEQQADRYDLSKHISQLRVERIGGPGEAQYVLSAQQHGDGRQVNLGAHTAEKLPDAIGKEMADRILKDTGPSSEHGRTHVYNGLDLKIGGEGMTAFYDNIVPKIVSGFLKKLGGGRVETLTFKFDNAPESVVEATARREPDHPFVKKNRSPQPGFAITPELRERVAQGLPLFSLAPAARPKLDATMADLKARLDQVGISDRVALKLTDIITNSQGSVQFGARGKYTAALRLIEVATHTDGKLGTLNHEIVHALRDLGVIRDAEWRVLTDSVLADKPLMKMIHEKYDPLGLSEAKIIEEAIAEKFRFWTEGTFKPKGFMRTAFERIKAFFEAVRNWWQDDGFQTAADIFKSIDTGEMGARPSFARGGFKQAPSFATDNIVDFPVDEEEMGRRALDREVAEREANPTPEQRAEYAAWQKRQAERTPMQVARDNKYRKDVFDTPPSGRGWRDILAPKAPKEGEVVPFADPGEDFSLDGRPKFNPKAAAAIQRASEPPAEDGLARRFFDEAIFRFQDKFNYLAKVQKAAARESGAEQVPEAEDAYLAELRYHGMAGAAIEDFQREHVDPLLEAISKSGLTIDDVDLYLHARHAPEANAQLKRINPDREDNDALSGMSDEEASEVIDDFKRDGNLPKLLKIGGMVDAVTKAQRDLLVKSGLESAETVKQWEDTYEFYAPLHREGFEGQTPQKGKGFSVTGRQKRRAGSTRDVVHVLAQIVAQHESTIVRAEKNKVSQAMLEFATNNPNKDLYEVDKVEYQPSFDADGLVTHVAARSFQMADNVVVAKVDGKDHTITFNTRNLQAARIAHAMKNLGADNSGPIINTLMKVTRFLAIVNTGANPEFIVSNFARDIQTAGYNLSATDADKLKWQIIKDVGKSWRGIRAFQKGKSHAWAAEFDAFRKAGAQTGWLDLYRDVAHREQRLKSKVKDMSGSTSLLKIKNGLRAVAQFVEHENTAVENAIRLSAFVHGRRAGMTEAQAARLAKELTVNFNRKGDYGQVMNALYLFYNASIQGSARIIAAGVKSPKVRVLMGATVVVAMFLDMLNREMGGDDEDGKARYDKIPDYVKERNLIIMLPAAAGDYVQIPLPWGYNVFHVMGQVMGEALTKRNFRPTQGGARVAGAVWGAFNPIGSEASISQMISPTIADPLVQWGENMDWSGRQLRPEGNPFDVDQPKSQQYWNSVREPSRWVTEKANELTGGNEIRPGWLDVNPEAIDLVIDTFTGGAGRFVTDTISTPIKAIQGKEIESYEIPMLRRVYGRLGQGALYEEYYRNSDAVRLTEKEAKHYVDTGDRESLAELRRDRSLEYGLISARRNIENEISKLRQARNRIDASKLSADEKQERLEAIGERMEMLMTRFNRAYQERSSQ